MTPWRVLAVDDEPFNLEIICECLDDPRYQVECASGVEEAWRLLGREDAGYHVAIVDRMMPGADGIELLRRMKADERLKRIPVILQTAAAAPEKVAEGVAAGAYYYLTKPYATEALVGIVQAALEQAGAAAEFVEQVRRHAETVRLIERAELSCASLADAGAVAALVAGMCPEVGSAAMGVMELLVNAVEHGNLGITYAEKTRLKKEGRWEEEIARRLALPEYRARRARVEVTRGARQLTLRVSDEGAGFDWHRYLDIDPSRAFDPNGRGIAMARMLTFSSIEYQGKGNSVVGTIDFGSRAAA